MSKKHETDACVLTVVSLLNVGMLAAPCAAAAAAPGDVVPTATQPSDDPARALVGDDIVVTAQRRSQRLSDVPISVQAVSGDTLLRAGIIDTRQLEQISPAVTFNTAFAALATSFSIRGVQSQTSEGGIQPSVGAVVDNMPLARQAELVLDLADIERIEVLAGPQGTLFGKNATAGVINIVTKRPTDRLEGEVAVTATTDAQVTVKPVINIPISDRLKLRLNGYYDYLDPQLRNIAGPGYHDEYGAKNYGFQGKLLFDISPDASLLVTAGYNHFNNSTGVGLIIEPASGGLGVLQRQILGPAYGRGLAIINQTTPAFDRGHSQSYVAELNVKLSSKLKLTAVGGYRKFDDVYGGDVGLTPVGVLVGVGVLPNPFGFPLLFIGKPAPVTTEYDYYSGEVRLNYTTKNLDVILGGYYQNFHERVQKGIGGLFGDGSLFGLTPGVQFYVDNPIDTSDRDRTAAVFGDATYTIIPTVKLFGGLRYSNERLSFNYFRNNYFGLASTYDVLTGANLAPPVATFAFTGDQVHNTVNNLSGRAGVQWQPQSGLNFYASYNRAYKGAAANTSKDISDITKAIVAPEIANAFEVGAKLRFLDGKILTDVAVFTQKIDNIQQTSVAPGTTNGALINAGALKTNGVEANILLRPVEGLSISSAAAYYDAKYAGNFSVPCGASSTPATCPTGLFNLNGTRGIGVPKVRVNSSIEYQRSITTDVTASLRAAFNWHSSIQYQLDHDPLTLEPPVGLVDLSVRLASAKYRWSATVFVKNATNKFSYSYLYSVDPLISRSFGYLPRDFRRYGGLTLTYAF